MTYQLTRVGVLRGSIASVAAIYPHPAVDGAAVAEAKPIVHPQFTSALQAAEGDTLQNKLESWDCKLTTIHNAIHMEILY